MHVCACVLGAKEPDLNDEQATFEKDEHEQETPPQEHRKGGVNFISHYLKPSLISFTSTAIYLNEQKKKKIFLFTLSSFFFSVWLFVLPPAGR